MQLCGYPREGQAANYSAWLLAILTLAAIALGLYMRVAILGTGSLWLDELWTLDAISRSFKEMVGARLVSDQSPPLWTVLTWVWLQWVGTYDASIMRILPALFGAVAIAAPLVAAVRMPTMRPTLLAMGSFMALSLFPLQFSVELRPYSMMIGMGTVATVIWVGLITAELPRSGIWIFLFALTGALAGFAHYYGNLLYLCESAVLLVLLARTAARRALVLQVAWGAVSIVPVVAWYVFTRPWARDEAVAAAPSMAEIQTWSTYVFSPITTIVRAGVPKWPEADMGLGIVLMGVALAAVIRSAVRYQLDAKWASDTHPVALVGVCSAVVILAGLSIAWVASMLLPPSMNTRNLAALLPAAFLVVAAACTSSRSPRLRWLTSCGVVGVWLIAGTLLLAQHGVAALAPPWQREAGYRSVSRALLASTHDGKTPTLVGLETTWNWHGQWDAAIRAETQAEPALSTDALELPIVWVAGVPDATALPPRESDLIVFSDSFDPRATQLFEWAIAEWESCENVEFGGPGFGRVDLLRCN